MKKIIIFVVMLLMIIASCKEDPEPSLYQPDDHAAANKNVPEITAIAPAGSSYAGVGDLVISGVNFNPTQPYNEMNQVVFSQPGKFIVGDIIAMTGTEFTVSSPVIVGDSIKVKVWASGADPYSNDYFYKLKPAVLELSPVDDKKGEVDYHSVTVTSDGRMLVAVENKSDLSEKGVIKAMYPDGTVDTTYVTNLPVVEGMRTGPGNMVYYTYSIRPRQIRKLDLVTGNESPFSQLSIGPTDLDFDPDLNLWVIGRQSTTSLNPSEIVRISADGSSQSSMLTIDTWLRTVRIYQDGVDLYIYFAGRNDNTNEEKIWRAKINNDGSLSSTEVVLDVNAASWINGHVESITFSASGTMYIFTTSSPDAVFRFFPQTGGHEVLYPGLLGPEIVYSSWDNGIFLYGVKKITGGLTRIYKIDLGEAGAPYYGRN